SVQLHSYLDVSHLVYVLEVVDRPRTGRVDDLVINHAEFEVCRCGTRVHFECLLKRLDGARVILSRLAAPAHQIIRLFLLIQPAFARGRTAAPSEAQQNKNGREPDEDQPTHAANLNELPTQRNGRLTRGKGPVRARPGNDLWVRLRTRRRPGGRGIGWPRRRRVRRRR